MTKAKLNKLMKQHNIVPSELDDVIDFVAEMLYIRRQEIEKEEPYANRRLDILFNAEHEVYDLIDYISELNEE